MNERTVTAPGICPLCSAPVAMPIGTGVWDGYDRTKRRADANGYIAMRQATGVSGRTVNLEGISFRNVNESRHRRGLDSFAAQPESATPQMDPPASGNGCLEAHLREKHSRRAPDSDFRSPQRGDVDKQARSFVETMRLARAQGKLAHGQSTWPERVC